MNMPKGKKILTPIENRAIMDKLLHGANPKTTAEDFDIEMPTLRSLAREWRNLVRLKRKFNDGEITRVSMQVRLDLPDPPRKDSPHSTDVEGKGQKDQS